MNFKLTSYNNNNNINSKINSKMLFLISQITKSLIAFTTIVFYKYNFVGVFLFKNNISW